ncbi:hypothetical protein OHB41_49805 [Streptomyces sp. NBC_01571]|uniref:hypothetical protein n=1 Tax=Streptomyces sp. NBC_01571 TaxID=2975883 RepID=UPI00225BDFBB|nr:hypothetical protein [Streptomyces sp. NBC_01571]MCX4581059.1 hypothetical protein [Streptomyces sp. NBC_01571]
MIRRMLRRLDNTPATGAPAARAVTGDRTAPLAASNPQPWTPGCDQDVAIRVGPFIERAHPIPGDDVGPDTIAVKLVHPDTPYATAYLHGDALGYTDTGWLRCKTATILGIWNPSYTALTHAAANLPLPDDVGMDRAHYAIHIQARRSDNTEYTLLRLGPYFQNRITSRDVDRLNTALKRGTALAIPDITLTAEDAQFNVNEYATYTDPYQADVVSLLADAIVGANA